MESEWEDIHWDRGGHVPQESTVLEGERNVGLVAFLEVCDIQVMRCRTRDKRPEHHNPTNLRLGTQAICNLALEPLAFLRSEGLVALALKKRRRGLPSDHAPHALHITAQAGFAATPHSMPPRWVIRQLGAQEEREAAGALEGGRRRSGEWGIGGKDSGQLATGSAQGRTATGGSGERVTGRGESQSHSRLIAEIFEEEEGDRIPSNHDYRLQDETARISD